MRSVAQQRLMLGVMLALLLTTGMLVATSGLADSQMHKSKPFAGPKANKGYVIHTKQGNDSILTLSDDFVVPDTPDPHWRVIDSKGTVYDLAKLKIKNDGYNKSIKLPPYVKDVAKVVIWCAFAETNLGEASFDTPVK